MNEAIFPKPNQKIASDRLELCYRNLDDAPICFQLIEDSREHLAPWMPWEESTKKVLDTENYFKLAQSWWDNAKVFDFSIFLKGTKTMIGSGGIHSIDWDKRTCDIGYWLGSKYEGQGYASEAVRALERMAYELGFHRIQIECDPKNKRSASVAKRQNYILESLAIDELYHDDKFRDTLRFSKLLNPGVPGYITENFPRGYGLKKVNAEEFKKITASTGHAPYDSSMIIRDENAMQSPTPKTNFDTGLNLYYILHFNDQVAGWLHGRQTHIDTLAMADSVVLPEHQDRKLYSRMLDAVIKECSELGFQRITSIHNMTHSKIIATKLRRGFALTGTSINIYAGTMVELTYFTNSLRKKVLEFRSGREYPDQEIKSIFKL